jgi:hypothetical protein
VSARGRKQSLSVALVASVASGLLALPAVARAPARMLVTAQEWSLMLSRGTLARGAVTVQLYNRGQDAHDLNIRRLDPRGRPTGSVQGAPATPSSGLAQVTWHLAHGRYVLYCSLPGHEAKGMRAYLTVR